MLKYRKTKTVAGVMDVFAPKYYKDFKCIADRCTHSCCVGWEIDIDEKTLKAYQDARGDYFDKIKGSIDYEGAPHFRLSAGERCPHLDGRGLCKIITECGEKFLCDICREHPRFYNRTTRGIEVGIGMACEEAARIILSSDSYAEFITLEESAGEPLIADFDAVREREEIYNILSDESLPYGKRLKKIQNDYGLVRISDADLREVLSSLEYLDEEHRELFSCYTSSAKAAPEYEPYLERALAYFIFRHTWCKSREEFKEALGFACFMERLFASLIEATTCDTEKIFELGRIISEEIEYSEDNTEDIKMMF